MKTPSFSGKVTQLIPMRSLGFSEIATFRNAERMHLTSLPADFAGSVRQGGGRFPGEILPQSRPNEEF